MRNHPAFLPRKHLTHLPGQAWDLKDFREDLVP